MIIHRLIGVEHSERVDEREIAGDCIELCVRYEPVFVVIVVLKHSLHTNTRVLIRHSLVGHITHLACLSVSPFVRLTRIWFLT